MTTVQQSNARLILADQGTSEVQSVLILNATGGTFTLSWNGQTTSALAYNAGANVVQNALAGLSNIGIGNVQVTNNAPYTVSFVGMLANAVQAMLTADITSLTGTGVTATISETTQGGATAFTSTELDSQYDLANGNFNFALCYLFRILWSNSAKFNDYTAGQTSEKKSQMSDHLKELSELYQQWGNEDRQLQLATMVPEPPKLRAAPIIPGVPATSLSYTYGGRYVKRYPWGPF